MIAALFALARILRMFARLMSRASRSVGRLALRTEELCAHRRLLASQPERITYHAAYLPEFTR